MKWTIRGRVNPQGACWKVTREDDPNGIRTVVYATSHEHAKLCAAALGEGRLVETLRRELETAATWIATFAEELDCRDDGPALQDLARIRETLRRTAERKER